MKLKESLFAYGSLTARDKFITALRITSRRFAKAAPNLSAVLYAIMEDFGEDRVFNSHQVEAISGYCYSKKTGLEMKEFFLMTLEDEELLVDYLNKEISARYWRRERSKKDAPDESQMLIDRIVSMNLGEFLKD